MRHNTGTDPIQDVINKDFLCRNDGFWYYKSSYSFDLSYTQYAQKDNYIKFYGNNDIELQLSYKQQGKNYDGIMKTYTSIVNAWGKYEIQENNLNCVFTYVNCYGNYDINTKHWTSGETNNKIYHIEYDGDYLSLESNDELHLFEQDNNDETGNQGGGSGGGNSYEKPEIGLMDYDCYSTSITVRWRIYNQDKANVTSAKGYYGTSSASRSTSATVSGSLITVRFTGLQKNTTYYLKCTATGKGGTTTSETTRLSTN